MARRRAPRWSGWYVCEWGCGRKFRRGADYSYHAMTVHQRGEGRTSPDAKEVTMAEGMRTCIGSEKFGIPRHEAPIEDFPAQPSQKDGLGRMCKPHWTEYTRGLRQASLAKKEPAPAPASVAERDRARADKFRAKVAGKTAKPKAPRLKETPAEKAMRVPRVRSGPTVGEELVTIAVEAIERAEQRNDVADPPASDEEMEAFAADNDAAMLAERRERIKARRRQEFTEASLRAQAAAGAKKMEA